METLLTILELFYLGVVDCICGCFALKRLWSKKNKVNEEESKTPRSRSSKSKSSRDVFLQCVVFGFLLWLSIFMFQVVVMNIYHYLQTSLLYPEEVDSIHWLPTLMYAIFFLLWKAPMWFASRILSFVWLQDIADLTCEDVGIKRRVTQSKSQDFSDQMVSALVQFLFYLQGCVFSWFTIPAWISWIIYLLHLSLLYALYAFEYKWCQKGWSMSRRLSYIECKWPYFMGFGFPLAVLTTSFDSYIESLCAFSVLFPITLIASTVTFNERLQSCNMPVRFFGVATPVGNFIVCCLSGFFWK